MIEIWQIGNTGVRNPMRIQDALRAYSESSLVGNIRGVPAEIAFMMYLGNKGVLNNEPGRDPSGSYGRKFRLLFNKMGFCYTSAKGLFGVSQSDIGDVDTLTPFGKAFLQADTVPAVHEFFARAMSVRMENLPEDKSFSPLRWTLGVLLEVERRTGSGAVNFVEFAAHIQTSTPQDDVGAVVDRILETRSKRIKSTNKKKFDADLYIHVKAKGGYPKKADNFKDYGDMNLRYLRATGLVRSKGRGIALIPEKHSLIIKLAESQVGHEPILERLGSLYRGAELPTDDSRVAYDVLCGLEARLSERGIHYELDCASLRSAAEVNAARYRLEELLSQNDEEIYAKEQKSKWEEIAAYMDLVLKRGGTCQLDDDTEIKVPKDEASAYLEWCMWRAFLAMNTLTNKPYEVRRFKVDQEFLPVGTAPGNGPDLIADYADCSVVIEVTLSDNSRQEAMEGEPVRRHVSDCAVAKGKPVYGLFVANHIDTNTAETFRVGTWYTKSDNRTRLNIIPVTLQQFRDYFVSVFKCGQHVHGEIVNLMRQCIVSRDSCEAPQWKTEIGKGFAQATRDKIWVQYHIQESIEESRQYVDWLPVYSLRAACGKFGEGQDVEALGWVKADGVGAIDRTMYVVQAEGRSMEPLIHDGDLCIMRQVGGGTYENKTMLVQHRGVEAPETGGSYSIKKYTRAGSKVVLVPKNHQYARIELNGEVANVGEYRLVGEFKKVLNPCK